MPEPPAYPPEVLTRTRKGDLEVRALVDRGRFVRYRYLDPETGEPTDRGKVKLVLRPDEGDPVEFFVIPTKGGRSLLLPAAPKGPRKVWDGQGAVDL